MKQKNDTTVSTTPTPEFSQDVSVTEPAVLRTSVRHPGTGVLCFTQEEWEAEDKKMREAGNETH